MLKTKVKASSITNLTDARYFAAYEVEWLGFNLEPGSKNSVSPQFVNAVKGWVDGVKIIGEFGLASSDEIKTAVESMNLDGVQVGMFTSLNEVIELGNISVLKEIIIDSETSENGLNEIFQNFEPHCEGFILNFDKNQISLNDIKSGKILSVEILQSFCQTYPIILSLNLDANILSEIMEIIKPLGINVLGGEEEKVGVKSFDELDEIFDSIEILV